VSSVRNPRTGRFDTAALDVDGTLVDSVYAHVWSWREAFRLHAVDVSAWRIHRAIGMGGDRLVSYVTNDVVERRVGDEVRGKQAEIYHGLAQHLTPTSGANDLLEACRAHGLKVVAASSGSRDDTEAALGLLESRGCIDIALSGDDALDTKPAADPVERAVRAVSGTRAFMVGDSAWDMEAARRAGHTAIAVLTGGIGECELRRAGAHLVYEDPGHLATDLGDVLHP
jgi:phosphoglycolate phosphatase